MYRTFICPTLDAQRDVFLGAAGLGDFSPIPDHLQHVRLLAYENSLFLRRNKLKGLHGDQLLFAIDDGFDFVLPGKHPLRLCWPDHQQPDKTNAAWIDAAALLEELKKADLQDNYFVFDMGLVDGTRNWYYAASLSEIKGVPTLKLVSFDQTQESMVMSHVEGRFRIQFNSVHDWNLPDYTYDRRSYDSVELIELITGNCLRQYLVKLPGLETRFIDYVVDQVTGAVFAYAPYHMAALSKENGYPICSSETSRQLVLAGYVPPVSHVDLFPDHYYVKETETLHTNNYT